MLGPSHSRIHITVPARMRFEIKEEAKLMDMTVSQMFVILFQDWTKAKVDYEGRMMGHQIVMSLAFSHAISKKLLSQSERAEAANFGTEIAKQMFGAVPPRPFTENMEYPKDARLIALHEAFLHR